MTDPGHPDHVKAGCPEDAQMRECPGSIILVLRELSAMASMGARPDERRIDDQAVTTYLRTRKGGLTKSGILWWALQRMQLGGTPLGGPKLTEVNEDDSDIDLPEYLKQ